MIVAVDFDGTLAKQDDDWYATALKAPTPVDRMVAKVRQWLAQGVEVIIFTASTHPLDTLEQLTAPDDMVEWARKRKRVIETFCETHLGRKLQVTCIKSYGFAAIYDDRAVRVVHNEGILVKETQVR